MRRKYLSRMAVSPLHGMALLLLLLLVCVTPQSIAAEPRPVYEVTKTVTMKVYRSIEEVTEVCRMGRSIKYQINGCKIPTNDPTHDVLIMIKPADFCDWSVMKTWGHELMHVFGWMHDKRYRFQRGDNEWTASHCAMLKP